MERVVAGVVLLAAVAGGAYGWVSTGRVLAVLAAGLVAALVTVIVLAVASVTWSLLTGRPDGPH